MQILLNYTVATPYMAIATCVKAIAIHGGSYIIYCKPKHAECLYYVLRASCRGGSSYRVFGRVVELGGSRYMLFWCIFINIRSIAIATRIHGARVFFLEIERREGL